MSDVSYCQIFFQAPQFRFFDTRANRYQIRIYIALCVFALVFIFGHNTATAQNILLNGEQQWLKIDVEAVDMVEVVTCEDEKCVYEIDRFSTTLCTSSHWVCNFPTPNNRYVLTCTDHTCVLNRAHEDRPFHKSFYKLILLSNGQTHTSNVQQTGKSKVATVESGRLVLRESRIDFDKLGSHPQSFGRKQGRNLRYLWFLFPIIEVLILFILFRFWRQRTNSVERPRAKFWIVLIIIHLILYFAYAILFDVSKPFTLVQTRVSVFLGLIPPVIVYLFLTIWFYHSTMPTWSRKVPIAFIITLVVFVCVIAFLVWVGLNMWMYGSNLYGQRGFSSMAALRVVFLIAVLIEAYLYRVIDREMFTSRDAFNVSLLTNSVSFGILGLANWFNL